MEWWRSKRRRRILGIGVLVTDMVMPEMGGRELALALRGSFPDIAVLLMSGYANAPMLRTEIEDTGFAFIEKPFTACGAAVRGGRSCSRAPAVVLKELLSGGRALVGVRQQPCWRER